MQLNLSKMKEIIVETTLSGKKLFVSIKMMVKRYQKKIFNIYGIDFIKLISLGKDKTGMGLGLSIVRQIIKHHGETIKVENTENGVIFTFSISIYYIKTNMFT